MVRWRTRSALASFALTTCVVGGAFGQDGDDYASCRNACVDVEEACLEGCADSDDPGPCEASCEDQSDACLDRCE